MGKHSFNSDTFHRTPIIGILRKIQISVLPPILKCCIKSKLTTIEITMNSPNATEQIRYAVELYGDRINIGAGTVRNTDELKAALEAGAGFIVTPNLNESVITYCKGMQIPIFPGAFTSTEIYRAYSLGANMVKVFPASCVGPGYFRSIGGPLDDIPLIATGGIGLDNMESYLRAGVCGFGIGSTMFDNELISRKDWTGLVDHMKKFVETVRIRY